MSEKSLQICLSLSFSSAFLLLGFQSSLSGAGAAVVHTGSRAAAHLPFLKGCKL